MKACSSSLNPASRLVRLENLIRQVTLAYKIKKLSGRSYQLELERIRSLSEAWLAAKDAAEFPAAQAPAAPAPVAPAAPAAPVAPAAPEGERVCGGGAYGYWMAPAPAVAAVEVDLPALPVPVARLGNGGVDQCRRRLERLTQEAKELAKTGLCDREAEEVCEVIDEVAAGGDVDWGRRELRSIILNEWRGEDPWDDVYDPPPLRLLGSLMERVAEICHRWEILHGMEKQVLGAQVRGEVVK